jgi:hypothetical protein
MARVADPIRLFVATDDIITKMAIKKNKRLSGNAMGGDSSVLR